MAELAELPTTAGGNYGSRSITYRVPPSRLSRDGSLSLVRLLFEFRASCKFDVLIPQNALVSNCPGDDQWAIASASASVGAPLTHSQREGQQLFAPLREMREWRERASPPYANDAYVSAMTSQKPKCGSKNATRNLEHRSGFVALPCAFQSQIAPTNALPCTPTDSVRCKPVDNNSGW